MDIFHSLVTVRVIFVLGVVNLVTALLILFSCRCLAGSKIGGKLMKYKPYQRFNKYHCYIWRVFWPSVVVHAFLAVMLVGWG